MVNRSVQGLYSHVPPHRFHCLPHEGSTLVGDHLFKESYPGEEESEVPGDSVSSDIPEEDRLGVPSRTINSHEDEPVEGIRGPAIAMPSNSKWTVRMGMGCKGPPLSPALDAAGTQHRRHSRRSLER